MYAVQYKEFGPPDVLTLDCFPEPHAGAGEVRIRVRAAGVSPVDVAVRAGQSPSRDRITLPHVPGVDATGVVDELGEGVDDVAVGDEVFGAVDVANLGGASAQFAVLTFWARKPVAMPWGQAGAAATSIETATRALDALGVDDTTTLLIDGAAGGVGHVAVQLAIARGAQVIGTGRRENHGFISGLGATPVTYGPGLASRLGALPVSRPDRALDTAGAGSLHELIEITGTAASVLTIADFSAPKLGVALSLGALGGQAHGEHGLAVAAELARGGRFHVAISGDYPMVRAADAHAALELGPRRRPGKTVLMAPDDRADAQ